MNSMI